MKTVVEPDSQVDNAFEQGVRTGAYRSDLSETSTLERNLLGVPLFVLHPKASRSTADLIYEWTDADGRKAIFTFERSKSTPFPLPQHAMYLSVMLAMFANNFSADGYFRFRFADIARNAGKSPTSRGVIETIQETIHRYTMASARWHYSWKGAAPSWYGPIIDSEDIWEMVRDGERIKRNPRNSIDPSKMHVISFHKYVVESIRSGTSRVILTEILRDGVSAASFCVYRYFYGFSDTQDVRRSWTRLRQAFPWTGQQGRFGKWLVDRLNELKDKGYVETFTVDDRGASVRSRSIDDVRRLRKTAAADQSFQLLRQQLPSLGRSSS